jgi:RNA polymerase primary sigma factor
MAYLKRSPKTVIKPKNPLGEDIEQYLEQLEKYPQLPRTRELEIAEEKQKVYHQYRTAVLSAIPIAKSLLIEIEKAQRSFPESIFYFNADSYTRDLRSLVGTLKSNIIYKEVRGEIRKTKIPAKSDKRRIIHELKSLLKKIEKGSDDSRLKEKNKEIAELFENYCSSRDELICSTLPLAVYIAKKYRNFGISFPDLIQEGNKGLIIAAEKYNPNENCKFGVYAYYCISSSILQAIQYSQLISVPILRRRKLREMEETRQSFELSGDLTALERMKAEISEFKAAYVPKVAISLDDIVDDGEGKCIIDLISIKQGKGREYNTALSAELFRQMNKLSPKQQEVLIEMYFRGKTLEQIGRKLNITRERVRQIGDKAIERLRHPKQAKHLESFLIK